MGKQGRKKNFKELLCQERKERRRLIKNWKERGRKKHTKIGEKELREGKVKMREETYE
jgi:hypothetical protein